MHPAAIAWLDQLGFDTRDFRSKNWEEFAQEGAPELDFVFTVCDNAAGEVCPIWPGQPMTAHWGIEDPAAVEGEAQERAFRAAFYALQRRIQLFLALPLDSIDELTLQKQLTGHRRKASTSMPADPEPLGRRLAAEGIGSFFLFAGVIGSGVMAEALAAEMSPSRCSPTRSRRVRSCS